MARSKINETNADKGLPLSPLSGGEESALTGNVLYLSPAGIKVKQGAVTTVLVDPSGAVGGAPTVADVGTTGIPAILAPTIGAPNAIQAKKIKGTGGITVTETTPGEVAIDGSGISGGGGSAPTVTTLGTTGIPFITSPTPGVANASVQSKRLKGAGSAEITELTSGEIEILTPVIDNYGLGINLIHNNQLVRSLQMGYMMNATYKNVLGGDEVSIVNASDIVINSSGVNVADRSHTGGLSIGSPTGIAAPYLELFGIKQGTGITVAYETSGVGKNIVISATGGGGGLSAGSTVTAAGGSYGLRADSSAGNSTGFVAFGLAAAGSVGFSVTGTETGMLIQNVNTGINITALPDIFSVGVALPPTVSAVTFASAGDVTAGQLSQADSGALFRCTSSTEGLADGLYFRIGASLYGIDMTYIGPV